MVAHVDPVTGDTEAFEVTAMGHPEFEMSSLDYWRFCQVLTVVQAALLIIGQAPSGEIQELRGGTREIGRSATKQSGLRC